MRKILNECNAGGYPLPKFLMRQGGFQVIFYKDIFTEEYLGKQDLNERQIKAVLYVKERGKITNKGYRELTGISDEGARKDLNDIVLKKLFVSKGKGRATHYILRKAGN